MGSSTVPAVTSGGLQPYSQVFATSGNWLVPTGVKRATVTCVGGGGGTYSQGGGAGGGGYIKTNVDVSAYQGQNIPITIGAGGVSSSAGASFITDGNTTSFGSLVYAYGGQASGMASKWQMNNTNNYVFPDSGKAENVQLSTNSISQMRWQELYGQISGTFPSYVGGFSNNLMQTIAYNGTNLFVAAPYTTNVTFTSSNGYTWTQNTTTNTACYQIHWNGTYFVTVPNATGTTAYYSTTGTSWTVAALPVSQAWYGCVGFTGLSVAYNIGSTSAAYSTNGTTWTAVTLPAGPSGSMMVANNRIYYFTNPGSIYYTTNGTTWNGPYSSPVTSVAYSTMSYNPTAGLYLMGPNSNNTTSYITSPDGVTWTSRTLPTASTTNPFGVGTSMTSGAVLFGKTWALFGYASGTGPTAYTFIYTSTDGINWTFQRNYFKGSPTLAAFTPNQGFTSDVFSLGNNRYTYAFFNTNGNRCSYGIVSDNFIGGYEGAAIPTNSLATGQGAIVSAAGAGFSLGMAGVTGTTTGTAGYGFPAQGSPEGWARGGTFMPGSASPSSISHFQYNNFGDGASAGIGGSNGALTTNGGQGLCIVEWWA